MFTDLIAIESAINKFGSQYFTAADINIVLSAVREKITTYETYYIARTQENNVVQLEISILLDKVLYDFTLRPAGLTVTAVFLKHVSSVRETYNNGTDYLRVDFFLANKSSIYYNIYGKEHVTRLIRYVGEVNTKIQNL
jgi:hypothetical protein